MSIYGVVIGALSIIVIGLWHPIVIKGEYYLGKKPCMIIFAIVGAASIIVSLFLTEGIVSVAIALFGFSALWGIHEVDQQEQRVKRGWFPSNPQREQATNQQEGELLS